MHPVLLVAFIFELSKNYGGMSSKINKKDHMQLLSREM